MTTKISFPCRCGHLFSLATDQAGLTVQCPLCGRLNDVPTLTDLPNIQEDGTISLQDAAAEDSDRLGKLRRVYNPYRIDEAGNEKDLRNTPEELEIALAGDLPAEHRDRGDVQRPKYDPETGELIRPIHVDVPTTQPIPVATPVVPYALPLTPDMYGHEPWIQLFLPTNVVVMLFVLIGYFLAGLVSIFSGIIGYFVNLPPWALNVVLPLLAAHYVSVVHEIGVEDRDELPRPLRNASFAEDIVSPLRDLLFSTFLCYTPAILILHFANPDDRLYLMPIAFVVGSVLFPAVLLTMVTSGSLANLRPDRLFKVMTESSLAYGIVVVGWILACTLTLWGLAGPFATPFPKLGLVLSHKFVAKYMLIPMILVHVYLMHAVAWKLGLIYRRHHTEFGWVLQRHVSTQSVNAAQRRNRALQQRRNAKIAR